MTNYVYERDDSLLSDIIKTIAKNEEGPRVRKLNNGIRVYTRNSQRTELNFNGGDYDHYTNFLVDDDGHVIAFEDWSSDFDFGYTDTVVYGKHTVAELHAIVDSLVPLVEIIEQELRNRLS